MEDKLKESYERLEKYFKKSSNEQRYGQFFMNALYKIDAGAYQHLCEHSDCFFDDSKFENSLRQLKEYYETKNKPKDFFTD